MTRSSLRIRSYSTWIAGALTTRMGRRCGQAATTGKRACACNAVSSPLSFSCPPPAPVSERSCAATSAPLLPVTKSPPRWAHASFPAGFPEAALRPPPDRRCLCHVSNLQATCHIHRRLDHLSQRIPVGIRRSQAACWRSDGHAAVSVGVSDVLPQRWQDTSGGCISTPACHTQGNDKRPTR